MAKHTIEGFGLNKAQGLAVAIDDGPALVVAGAGTGKTRVIVDRIARLLQQGVEPKQLLALTFTEKAAQEMIDRVNQVVGTYEIELPIMTFNAFGESLLREFAPDIGWSGNFMVMGDNAQIVFLRERLDRLHLDYFAPLSQPDGQLSNLRDYFSKLKQNVIIPEDYSAFVKQLPTTNEAEKSEKRKQIELAKAFAAYLELCQEASVIDYDDQLYLLIRLLRARPNVLAELQKRFAFVMVDEFQDTNTMQSELVDLLVGKRQNLFVVGDDDQSIYGWRGATLANILDFKKRYPKARDITLIDNYRSTQEILDAAHKLIQHNNPERLEVRLNINKHLQGRRHGAKPQVNQFETLDAELDWVAQDIKRQLDAGTAAGSIAVLARRNATLQQVHNQLAYAGIDHVVIGQRFELYHEPIVRQLLEVLRAIVDPLDSLSLYHSLTGPLFNVPVHNLARLAASSKRSHEHLYDALKASNDKADQGALAALEQLDRWREKASTVTVGQLAYDILDESGYRNVLYKMAAKEPVAAQAVSRLAEWFRTMKEFEAVAVLPSALQYVDALPALQAAGDLNEDGTLDLSEEVVNVLSIHKAKGLEWAVVYLVDCNEGSLPLRNIGRGLQLPEAIAAVTQSAADDHLAEERRLMYVAMTRAKDELYLSCAKQHNSGVPKKPSRFLLEAFGETFKEHMSPNSPTLPKLASYVELPSKPLPLPRELLEGDMVKLTISQVQKYLDCPLDFYYRYVLHVPHELTPAQAYGTLMHQLIEAINRGIASQKVPPLNGLMAQLASNWPKVGHLSALQRDRALERAKQNLTAFYEQAKDHPSKFAAIEEPFRVRLNDYKVILRGRFDAVIDHGGDGIEIIDYKTSGNVDTSEKAKQRATSSEQLTLYALAWQQLHTELPSLVTLAFVATNMRGSVKKTQRGIDGAHSRLQKVANGIRGQLFEPGKDHSFCLHPPL